MTVGLLLLATHKYKQFVQSLVDDVKKYFLSNHNIEIHLFTDDYELPVIGDERVSIRKELIVSWRFPTISLYRYKIFTHKKYPNCDYLFYLDVDMKICETIGEEILGDIVGTLHPGFYNGGGSWETNEQSMCFTQPENRKRYYAGGFSGGKTEKYYREMVFMKNLIDADERNDVMPVWHDESVWNFVCSIKKPTVELTPEYCMVEQQNLREEWGISHFKPKIIALAKNHEEIRS